MRFDIAILPGDGVGPEVTAEAMKVLQQVGEKFEHDFSFHYGDVGGVSIDRHGVALTSETLEMCRKCETVLLGAVGGPKWEGSKVRPEEGLLALRKNLGLFANLRPVKFYPALLPSISLKPEVVRGVELIFVRELTGGIYFGKPRKQWQTSKGRRVVDTLKYSEEEIQRILKVGFELARQRRKRLTSVDKANVLESSRLWRQIADELSAQYPDVELQHQLVDACAMRLIQKPSDFDVLVTENMFGDILTDEVSTLAGSLGMLPSASLAGVPGGGKAFGLYEPAHGSAPDIAGKDLANPLAAILSCALMLRYSLDLTKEADAVEKAVEQVLEEGYRTSDIAKEEGNKVGTGEMGNLVAERIQTRLTNKTPLV